LWCQVANEEDELLPLQTIFGALKDVLFGLAASDMKNFRDVPPEVFQVVSWPEFRQQYMTLRNEFIPELLAHPTGRPCWVVDAVEVRMSDGQVVRATPSAVQVASSTSWGRDLSLQFGSEHSIGKLVRVGSSEGTVIAFHKHMQESTLYKLLMTQPYSRVRSVGVWHALRLYHRLVMAGCTTEQLAETVGSMLTKQSRGGGGRKADLADMVEAVKLRAHGVTGSRENISFITRSLNIYFRGKPWHFLLSQKGLRMRGSVSCLGPSVAVHNYRMKFSASVKFNWLREELAPFLRSLGRRNLRDGVSVDSKFMWLTPRAGFRLQRAQCLKVLSDALEVGARLTLPTELDERLWSLLARAKL